MIEKKIEGMLEEMSLERNEKIKRRMTSDGRVKCERNPDGTISIDTRRTFIERSMIGETTRKEMNTEVEETKIEGAKKSEETIEEMTEEDEAF